MAESIIVGLVVGAGVGVIGAFAGHRLRLREMRAQWAEERLRMQAHLAEEERRRKSERRREQYEKELKMVKDATDILMEAIGKVKWSTWEKEDWKTRAGWVREVSVMIWRASVVGISPVDQELRTEFNELVGIFNRWLGALDVTTGEATEGVEKEEFEELVSQLRLRAAKVRRRISTLLEEV